MYYGSGDHQTADQGCVWLLLYRSKSVGAGLTILGDELFNAAREINHSVRTDGDAGYKFYLTRPHIKPSRNYQSEHSLQYNTKPAADSSQTYSAICNSLSSKWVIGFFRSL